MPQPTATFTFIAAHWAPTNPCPFRELNPNGEWVLFVAEMESGDIFTLDNWGLESTGYTPPSIVSSPLSLTNECSTGSAVFSVTATGSEPLAYQWRVNGAPVSGATSS